MTKFQMTISDVQVMQTWTLLMCAAEIGKFILMKNWKNYKCDSCKCG